MIIFWLLALVLLICALLLLLWPVLKVRKNQAEEDRTALNVALYQERLAELESQLAAGTLTAELFAQGQLEAERELLDDTATGAPQQKANLGMALPLLASLLVPVAGAGLYMVWGASEQVQATLQRMPVLEEQQAVDELMRRIPQISDDAEREAAANELIARLENIVRMQPEAADVQFFLGRHYMSEQRHVEAANAFALAMNTAGRQPEILAQWAQAQFFAGNKEWNPELQQAVDEVLAINPGDVVTLGFVGIAGFESGNYPVAIEAWGRLLAGMDSADPAAAAVITGIERAEAALQDAGDSKAQTPAPSLPALPDLAKARESGRVVLQVSLDDELQGRFTGSESVFVFARAAEGSPLPLAAQRLTLADLPAEITLSDADAVMGDMKLSTTEKVQVQASVSLDGNAANPSWLSELQIVTVDTGETFKLTIDRVPALTGE